MAYGLIAMTLCLPSMQEWAAIFGTTQARVQLTFSGYVLAFGAAQLLYGPLSDRYGRRAMLMIGLALTGLGSLAAAFAADVEALIAARVLQGAGSAAGLVVGRAAVQDLFEGPQRTRMMAYTGMAMGLCPPLATVVGGQLHAQLGWRANFVVLAVLAPLLMVVAWRRLPAHGARRGQGGSWLGEMGAAYARLLRERRFLLHVAVLALTAATFYAYLGGAPLVLGSYGVGPAQVGWYIMVPPLAYIGGNYAASRLARAGSEHRCMRLGQQLTLGGIATMLVLGWTGAGSPLAFALPLVLMGAGHGLLIPPCLSITVGLVPALAGAAAALTGVLQQAAGAFGGYAVGWVSHDGQVHLGLVMLALAGAGAAAQALLHRHVPPVAEARRAG